MREKNSYSRFVQSVVSWKNLEKGSMIQLLHHCIEHDISTFDSADFPGGQIVDRTFGTALSESGLSRDEIQLVSKYSISKKGREDLVSTVDNLLLTLKTDYLDLLFLDFPVHWEETKMAVEQLWSQGKILEIGELSLQEEPHKELFQFPIRATQLNSPFDSPSILEKSAAKKLASEDIDGFMRCDLQKTHSEDMEIVLCDVAQKNNVSRAQLLLAWILRHPAHFHPVIDFSTKEEIPQAVASKEFYLAPIDWEKINSHLS